LVGAQKVSTFTKKTIKKGSVISMECLRNYLAKSSEFMM
jgi:hypothetical protein